MRARVHDVRQREPRIQDDVHEAGPARVVEAEATGHRRAAQISVNEEHPGVGRLGKRTGEVDGRGRFSVGGTGTRDRDHRQLGRLVALLDQVAQRPVLLGFERARREQAH